MSAAIIPLFATLQQKFLFNVRDWTEEKSIFFFVPATIATINLAYLFQTKKNLYETRYILERDYNAYFLYILLLVAYLMYAAAKLPEVSIVNNPIWVSHIVFIIFYSLWLVRDWHEYKNSDNRYSVKRGFEKLHFYVWLVVEAGIIIVLILGIVSETEKISFFLQGEAFTTRLPIFDKFLKEASIKDLTILACILVGILLPSPHTPVRYGRITGRINRLWKHVEEDYETYRNYIKSNALGSLFCNQDAEDELSNWQLDYRFVTLSKGFKVLTKWFRSESESGISVLDIGCADGRRLIEAIDMLQYAHHVTNAKNSCNTLAVNFALGLEKIDEWKNAFDKKELEIKYRRFFAKNSNFKIEYLNPCYAKNSSKSLDWLKDIHDPLLAKLKKVNVIHLANMFYDVRDAKKHGKTVGALCQRILKQESYDGDNAILVLVRGIALGTLTTGMGIADISFGQAVAAPSAWICRELKEFCLEVKNNSDGCCFEKGNEVPACIVQQYIDIKIDENIKFYLRHLEAVFGKSVGGLSEHVKTLKQQGQRRIPNHEYYYAFLMRANQQ